MAFDYEKALRRILGKASLIEERYNVLLKSRNEALAKIEELEQRLQERDKELEKLKLQMEYLQMASTIAPSREDVERVRSLITGLVRDIDRCITDLSD